MPLSARAFLTVLAAVLCAWFGLGVIQARDTARATSLLTSTRSPTPEQLRRVRSMLDSAATLNPDQTVQILRGVLELDSHHPGAAERTLLAVTHNAPLNADAWVQLAFAAARNGDGRTLLIAGRQVSKLHPKIP